MEKEKFTIDKVYSWAYATASTILEKRKEDGTELIRRLVFAIRGEETPGRFLDKLATTLIEYRTNRAYELPVSIPKFLTTTSLIGDIFHYVRAAILAGLLDAMASRQGGKAT